MDVLEIATCLVAWFSFGYIMGDIVEKLQA